MDVLFVVLLVFLLIGVNVFFVGVEFVLILVCCDCFEVLVEQGKVIVVIVIWVGEQFLVMLIGVQLGVMVFLILFGWVGELVVVKLLQLLFGLSGVLLVLLYILLLVIVVVLYVLFGEMVLKNIVLVGLE